MSRRVRRFLVVLLMLALPWQGVAAASMRLCEAMHGAGAAPATEVHGVHRAAAVQVDSAMRSDSAQHCQDAAVVAAVDLGGSADTDVATGSCSACAVCCLTAAMATGALDVGHPLLGGVQTGRTVVPEPARPPERLERPPRSA